MKDGTERTVKVSIIIRGGVDKKGLRGEATLRSQNPYSFIYHFSRVKFIL